MGEIKCTCGGTFEYLGTEYLRTGNIQFLVDKDAEEKCIPCQLYVCDQCRALRLCADTPWVVQRRAWWAQERHHVERNQQLDQNRFHAFLKTFAGFSSQKLERIAGGGLFSGYDEVGQAAARQLLEERKANPDAAPREQEHVQPEPRPSWTRRKNSKPPWER